MYTGHFPELGFGRTRHAPPVTFEDEAGREIAIRVYGEGPVDDEYEALVDMYLDFDPAQRSLGIPPRTEARIREWQDRILGDHCVVAWHDDRPVGQAVLVEDEFGNHELAIFVHQAYHHAGIGTRLVEALLAHGEREGVDNVWLLVEGGNEPARRLYDDAGFTVTDDEDHALVMALSL